jgi:adenosylmethionine-8-amino-7-oxononanoate aminotransferase
MAPGALLNENEVFSAPAEVHISTPSKTYSVIPKPWNTLLHRDLRSLPLTLMEADGIWLKVTNGSEPWMVLDGSGGAAVSNIGHKDLRVMRAQFDHFLETGISYTTSASFQTEIAQEFAYFLLESTNFQMARVVFYSSGMRRPSNKITAY